MEFAGVAAVFPESGPLIEALNSFIEALNFFMEIFNLYIKILTSGSVNETLNNHILDIYGIKGLLITTLFPSLPHFIRTIEDHVLNGTEASITKFRKNQESLLANTGTTAAIISQVTVTSLQFSNIGQISWVVRAFFYSSLVFSIFSIFMSFLKHRDITSMENFDIRVQLKSQTQEDPFKPTKLNLEVVLAFYLPYAMLNTAITTYCISLLLFLIFSMTQSPNVDGTELGNRNILIFFVISLAISYYALIWVQYTRLHRIQGFIGPGDTTKILGHYPGHYPPQGQHDLQDARRDLHEFTERFERIEYSYATTRRAHDNPEGTSIGATRSPSHSPEFIAAMKEATDANKAAVAAIQKVAAQLERLSTGCLAQNTLAGDATTIIPNEADAITPVPSN